LRTDVRNFSTSGGAPNASAGDVVDVAARDDLKLSFDDAAPQYEEGRPTYPLDAARWLLTGSDAEPDPEVDVLDLGAGTGALTRQLADLVRSPFAVEPSHQMLLALVRSSSVSRCAQAFGEQLPFRSRAFDVVTIAQAFHWLDHETALPEIARVLRPSGALAVVYNTRDESRPWAKRFGELLVSAQPPNLEGDWGSDSVDTLAKTAHFSDVVRHQVVHDQLLTRAELIALAGSRSYVVRLAAAKRDVLLADVGATFDDSVAAGGLDVVGDPPRLRLTYVTDCWRARVVRTFSAT
jgi:SAM-dependent methyltransferase